MPRIFATLHLVAFLCEVDVHCFFLAEPFSSSSLKDSDDEGDIKILEYVFHDIRYRPTKSITIETNLDE